MHYVRHECVQGVCKDTLASDLLGLGHDGGSVLDQSITLWLSTEHETVAMQVINSRVHDWAVNGEGTL